MQRLLASDDGEEARYRSTSSLASQESKDSGRFFQSLDPLLPQKSEVNEAFWADHKITGNLE